jgi:hypothetical protein
MSSTCPTPCPAKGQRLYEVGAAGIDLPDTHDRESPEAVRIIV